jgi:hypothetical protein
MRRGLVRKGSRWVVFLCGACILCWAPSTSLASHAADHRFTVHGFVCGTDGKPSPQVEILIKDTKISYGQVVNTDSEGYYSATFHLHNENLGDALLVEARGESRDLKVQFDPKDLETERKLQVDFGTGCQRDLEVTPQWVFYGLGGAGVAVAGLLGFKAIRKRQRQSDKRGKGPSKKKR